MLIAKLRCSHKSCTNTPEYGCSKQFRCAAHNAAHIKDVIAKQVRLTKAQEPSSLDRKPPRAPCLGVPQSDDNPNGDHSTTLLRVVTEVRKGIAKNAAESKWADKRELIVTVTPPTTELGGGADDPPPLIPMNASVHPLHPAPLPLDASTSTTPLPLDRTHTSSASPSPSPSTSFTTQGQSAVYLATSTPTSANSAPMPAPHPNPRTQQPKYVEILSFFRSNYFI